MYSIKKIYVWLAITSICFILIACGPSPKDLAATALAQTASAATNTPIPSSSPTPDANVQINQGLEFAQAYNWDEAINEFTNAITKDPTIAEAYFYRGEALYQQGKNEAAITDLNKAIDLDPSNAEYYSTRGVIHDINEEPDKALADYDKAIELDPEYANAYAHRGITYRDQGMFEEALQEFDIAIELSPENPGSYYNRGKTYTLRGDYKVDSEDYEGAFGDFTSALEEYDKALAIDDTFEMAYYWKGRTQLTMKMYEEAIQDFSSVIDLNPLHSDAFLWRGYCHLIQEDFRNAENDLITSLEVMPIRVDGLIFILLGDTYYALEQIDEAIESYEMALQLDLPTNLEDWANYSIQILMEDKTSPWFGKPSCARDTDGNFDPDLLTSEFFTNDPLGFVLFRYQNMVDGTSWKYIWTSEDGITYETVGNWDGGKVGTHITYFSAPSFGPSKWTYTLFLEDNQVREIECRVVEP